MTEATDTSVAFTTHALLAVDYGAIISSDGQGDAQGSVGSLNSILWGQTWVPAGGRAVTLDREDTYVTDRLFRHNMFYTVAGATEGADMGSDQETNPGIDLATFHLAMESRVENGDCLALGPLRVLEHGGYHTGKGLTWDPGHWVPVRLLEHGDQCWACICMGQP